MNVTDLVNKYPGADPYLTVILVLVISFLGIGMINKFIKKHLLKTVLPPDIQNLFQRIIVYVLWFAVLMFIVAKLQLEEILIPLMGASFLVGAAVALAVKDILSDAVAGVFILMDKHFDIGDEIETMGHKGQIVNVTLRKTRIRTDDKMIVVLPNGKIDAAGWTLHEKKTPKE